MAQKSRLVAADRDWLREYIAVAPVALALLRAIECREVARQPLESPLLDLGCGDGVFGQVFYCAQPQVGLDYSERELQTCQSRQVYRALVRGDIGRLPFEDNHFRTVFSNGVLEHVMELGAGLREVRRVLRPDGYLVMTVPTLQDELEMSGAALLRWLGWHKGAQAYADIYNRAFGQVNLLDIDEWRELMARVGLEIVSHRAYAGPRVFRLHDLTMLIGLPNHLCKVFTGRWVLWPEWRRLVVVPIWERLLRRLYLDEATPGCSLLIVARATASG